MEDLTKIVAETLSTDPTTAFIIIVASLAALVLFILFNFVFSKGGGKAQDRVLLIGLSDSGKTSIFSSLVTSQYGTETFTSMHENVYSNLVLESSKYPVTIIDIPGADKVRPNVMNKFLSAAGTIKAIMFVVDSTTFVKQSKDVAELFYDVMCSAYGKSPVAVVCNKQDLPVAKSPQVVKNGLEKEFGLLNKSRAAALDSTDDKNNTKVLGSVDWSDVEFLEASARPENEGDDSLEAVRDWLAQL